MENENTTHSDSATIYFFTIEWKGRTVPMTAHDWPFPCAEDEHDIGVMHHLAEADGKEIHFCPTGFLYCHKCCAAGYEPGQPECTRWGVATK